MKKTLLPVALLGLLLGGCAEEGDDLRMWMANEAATMVGRIKPLPEVKPFPVVNYDQGTAVEPFSVSRIRLELKARSGDGPDMSRPREPLEAYPLESLHMVGALIQNNRSHALIGVSGRVHQVAVGNYMGQDHGMITKVTDSEVTLTEIVEDMNGDWVERTSRLLLQER